MCVKHCNTSISKLIQRKIHLEKRKEITETPQLNEIINFVNLVQ